MSYNTDKPPCHMQPDNMGIGCSEPPDSDRCRRCGWNPAEAERRHNETIKMYEEKENKTK